MQIKIDSVISDNHPKAIFGYRRIYGKKES